MSDPGAVAVWPPVRRPNIHGVTFDDVRVELRVSGVAAPTRPRRGHPGQELKELSRIKRSLHSVRVAGRRGAGRRRGACS